MALGTFQAAYAALDEAVKAGESQADAVPAAREILKTALSGLLTDVAAGNSSAEAVDRVLVTWRAPAGKYDKDSGPLPPLLDAALLKGSLLAALKSCAHYPALLAMPQLLETTRKLLCAAPAKGVATFLVDALGADIDACHDAKVLSAVQEVLRVHMQAEGRLKKDLGGFVLAADNTKSVRTAANKAAKTLAMVEEQDKARAADAAKKAAAEAAKVKAAEFAALQKGVADLKTT